MREIAEDPQGFMLRQGWASLDFGDVEELAQLRRLHETLQKEIAAVTESLKQLRESPDYELCQLSEQKPGVLDELAAERTRQLNAEITDLEKQAEQLANEIKKLTNQRPDRGMEAAASLNPAGASSAESGEAQYPKRMKDATAMTTMKQILRWLTALPGGVLAGIVVLFPIHWVAMFVYYFGGLIFGLTITKEGGGSLMSLGSLEGFMDALFVCGTVIAVAARIAPRFHFVTAVVVALLIIGSLSFYFADLGSLGLHIAESPFMFAVHIILFFTSVIFALFYARDLDDRDKLLNP